jgi:hypothetical protein
LDSDFTALRGGPVFAIANQDSHLNVAELERTQPARGFVRYTPLFGNVQDGMGGARASAAMSP